MHDSLKRIAITGPESTGKSSLSKLLAKHYNAHYVPEFARAYIDKLNRPYTFDDILVIAQNQVEKEVEARNAAKGLLFSDTELIVTKVWSMHKYGKCDAWINEQILKQEFDLYLLCNVDLPWEYDKQREHPHLRKFFLEWYRKELDNYGFPYCVISGEGEERVQNAIQSINNHFKAKK